MYQTPLDSDSFISHPIRTFSIFQMLIIVLQEGHKDEYGPLINKNNNHARTQCLSKENKYA